MYRVLTAQKMKFSSKDFFGKRIWSQFSEEILKGKLRLLCSTIEPFVLDV